MHPETRSDSALDEATRLVDQSYDDHRGFRHPLWDWMANGKYSVEQLKSFALLYYEHVKIFRQYLVRALSIVPAHRENLQVALASILADEYGLHGSLSHPELFRSFMRSLELTESDWSNNTPIRGIVRFRNMHYRLFQAHRFPETMGAIIFGLERTTPYRHGKVLQGLARFDELNGTKTDGSFFSDHIEIDPHHSGSLLTSLRDVLLDNSGRQLIAKGAQHSFRARKIFLDDLQSHLDTKLPLK